MRSSAFEDQTSVMQEIKSGNNFGYLLVDDSYFSSMDYKVLQSQKSGLFIDCVKMLYNGKIELYYITEDVRPVSSLFRAMTPDMLADIIINIIGSIMEVKNNGFLKSTNIDISWNKVYVELATLKIKLVYLPISQPLFESYGSFESALRAGMVKLINQVITLPNARLSKMLRDLIDGSVSIEQIYSKYKGGEIPRPTSKTGYPTGGSGPIRGTNPVGGGSSTGRSSFTGGSNRTPLGQSFLKMVAINAPQPFEAVLDRPDMIVGRKKEVADILISFNKMIGRKHCRVTSVKGAYYIIDEGSVNGTYVNGVRVPTHHSVAIKRGDIIRMADSEFKLV